VRFGVDLTACWRPRVGMVTAAMELSGRLFATPGPAFTAFLSRERLPGVGREVEAVLSPHRHELLNKLTWLPLVEPQAGLDAMFYPYWPSPPVRRRGAPPAVVFVHDLAFRLHPNDVPWQQRFFLGSLLPRSLASAAAVLTASEATRKDLLACYPLPDLAERVKVVPLGPTPLELPAADLPAGLAPGFLLAVGTIEARKNYSRLVEAHARLHDAPPLVIAGRSGWNGFRLPERPGVRQLGHVSDATLRVLYEQASLLAFPSLYEGFGIPLVDAMVHGLPALVGNRGALPEVAGDAALVVDPTSVEEIAAGLQRLLDDKTLRQRLAGAARRRARDFTWERAANLTLRALTESAAGH